MRIMTLVSIVFMSFGSFAKPLPEELAKVIQNPDIALSEDGSSLVIQKGTSDKYKVSDGVIKAKDNNFVVGSGNLKTNSDKGAQLSVARKDATKDSYVISTFEVKDESVTRATECHKYTDARLTGTDYHCYYASENVCKLFTPKAAALLKKGSWTEAELKNTLLLTNVRGAERLTYFNRDEAFKAADFGGNNLKLKIGGFRTMFHSNTRLITEGKKTQEELLQDLKYVISICGKYFPKAISATDDATFRSRFVPSSQKK